VILDVHPEVSLFLTVLLPVFIFFSVCTIHAPVQIQLFTCFCILITGPSSSSAALFSSLKGSIGVSGSIWHRKIFYLSGFHQAVSSPT
jgi:hypothetical protein